MTSKKALEILVNNLREVIVKLNEKITNLKLEKSTILEEINNRIALNLGDNSELSALECLKEWIEIQIREKK